VQGVLAGMGKGHLGYVRVTPMSYISASAQPPPFSTFSGLEIFPRPPVWYRPGSSGQPVSRRHGALQHGVDALCWCAVSCTSSVHGWALHPVKCDCTLWSDNNCCHIVPRIVTFHWGQLGNSNIINGLRLFQIRHGDCM